ncbi:MAG: helix-turn-helix domain-containing protein [Lachnospiraceae bacterium]|nr:helix-turn-helix domain-containing protein [Lachnospiraceae bacterium]
MDYLTITTKTLDVLCTVLDCFVSEILEYVKPEDI